MQMIRALYPVFNNGQGVSYTCRSICQSLQGESLKVEAWFPASEAHARRRFVRDACPRLLMPVIYRLPDPGRRLANAAERAFLRALRPGDIAYLWPGVSVETYERIKDRGITIVTERINCHTGFAKRLLDQEYDRIGWPVSHDLTEQHIASENSEVNLADFIFAPSTWVARSFDQAAVPRQKILRATYGWDPQRFQGNGQHLPKHEGLTVVFVGRLCIRKGIHLLLEAWDKARIKGRLLLAGALHHDVEKRLATAIEKTGVVQLGHTPDVGAVLRCADLFVLGSLEEGSPLVTYEALGCGLPVLVSPMGAGPARDGIEGFVREPHDIDGWVAALRRFAEDVDLRKQMGQAARARANEFTWEKVGARRRKLLQSATNSHVSEEVAVPA